MHLDAQVDRLDPLECTTYGYEMSSTDRAAAGFRSMTQPVSPPFPLTIKRPIKYDS